MICPNCGNKNVDGTKFCISCGASLVQAAPAPTANTNNNAVNTEKQPGHGLAVASMVCGIVGLVICCYGIILDIVALALGGVAKSKGNKSAMGTAGITCGIVGLALSIGIIIYFVAVWGSVAGAINAYSFSDLMF